MFFVLSLCVLSRAIQQHPSAECQKKKYRDALLRTPRLQCKRQIACSSLRVLCDLGVQNKGYLMEDREGRKEKKYSPNLQSACRERGEMVQ
jgi:hypothetical protein